MNTEVIKRIAGITLLCIGTLSGNYASAWSSNFNNWNTPITLNPSDFDPFNPPIIDFTPYYSQPFKILIDTRKNGITRNNSFQIPTTGGGYNYRIDCNSDGIDERTGVHGNFTCSYNTPGEYTISINGEFPQIYFNDGGHSNQNHLSDSRKIQSIKQWGTGKWRSMKNAFSGCSDLEIEATDLPDLTNVTDMSYMLANTSNSLASSNIDRWDVSNVQNMSGLFHYANNGSTLFQASLAETDISNWDVGNVTDMSNMFKSAYFFNPDISNWNVSKVTNMNFMFYEALVMNRNIGGWDVSNVTNMEHMFDSARSFNQDLGDWNVSNVSVMNGMFNRAELSTQNYDSLLNSWIQLPLQTGVNFDGGRSKFSRNASYAHSLYFSIHQWNIRDGGRNW